VLFQYDFAAFWRQKTSEERGIREELDPTPAAFHIENDTYIEVNPARLKRRILVRLLADLLNGANTGTRIATDQFEHIIAAERFEAPDCARVPETHLEDSQIDSNDANKQTVTVESAHGSAEHRDEHNITTSTTSRRAQHHDEHNITTSTTSRRAQHHDEHNIMTSTRHQQCPANAS
jgi:hypothetical protein